MLHNLLLESDQLYWSLAIGGSALFVLRLTMMLFGLASDDHETVSDDSQFELLTMHSLTGFAMMFGWIGLGCLKQTALGPIGSCVMAFLAGIAMLFVTKFIFSVARKLISQGSDFQIQETIGKEAMVYQRIPEKGTGKVHVIVNNSLRELLAVSKTGEQIDSFQHVQIICVLNDQTVEVKL